MPAQTELFETDSTLLTDSRSTQLYDKWLRRLGGQTLVVQPLKCSLRAVFCLVPGQSICINKSE